MRWMTLFLTVVLVFTPRSALAQLVPPGGGNPGGSGSQAPGQTAKGAFGEKVEVVVRIATALDRLCGNSARAALAANFTAGPPASPVPPAALAAARVGALCRAYGNTGLEFSKFMDAGLAAAGLALDADAMQAVLADITPPLDAIARAVENSPNKEALKAAGLPSSADLGGMLVSGSVDFGSATLDLATVALSGLAKLIVERARFEAVGWFLDELGKNLCATEDQDGKGATLGREMTRHVAPNLCQLAGRHQLWEYGAGAALWQSLQTAAADDLKGLPGMATGLLSLSLLVDPKAAIGCEEKEQPPAGESATQKADREAKEKTCVFANTLRKKTAARTLEILRGDLPTVVLDHWSQDLENLTPSGANTKLYDGVQCAAAIPRFIEAWDGKFREANLDKVAAPLIAAAFLDLATGRCKNLLATLPQITINPQGFKRSDLRTGLSTLSSPVKGAGTVAAPVEKLSALLDFAKTQTFTDASNLEASLRRFREAVLRFEQAGKAASATFALQPNVTVNADAKPEAVGAVVDALTKNLRGAPGGEKADAAFGLADATLELAVHVSAFMGKVSPGNANVAELQVLLERLRKGIAIGRAAVKGEWAAVVNQTLVLLEELDASQWLAGESKIGGHLRGRGKDLATLVAIASAKDGDEMAKALDALADPPGGWRTKRKKYQDTVSLTAHAGFYVAGELRYGAYGAVVEGGRTLYGQPPTLALPFGLEYSRGLECGCTSVNVFLSALDPAGYLGYDANSGKVTGASLLTAVAPGLEVSFALGDSPFNLGPFFMFRPGYRQLEPNATSFGAHAMQLGALLSVDVTLFTLYSRERGAP